ncbi:MAG: hypothetical protein ABII80_03865 [bacterium]
MVEKINFLKNTPTLSDQSYQKERDYFRYSIVGVIVVIVIMLGGFIWQYVLTRRFEETENRITEMNQQLIGLTEASAQQIYLKSRLKLIEQFLSDRTVSREAIQQVFSLTIPGVIVSGVSFEDDNTITLQTEADDVLSFANLVDYFSEDTRFFLQVVSKGVSRSDVGVYQMQLSLTLPQES